MSRKQLSVLIFIVLAQFMCTSLWFAGNAVISQLTVIFSLSSDDIGLMISSVQIGFIVGTFGYALLTIADRFKASNVFLISAILGAISNLLIAIMPSIDYTGIILLRIMTGFFLAGIYPIGMKIASDYFEKGLGKALSFLVGSLVLGTAIPFLIASSGTNIEWQNVIYATSILAIIGGFLVWLFVGEGPYQTQSQKPKFEEMKEVFKDKEFKAASIGYFGHMWELYTFWAFVPFMFGINGYSNDEFDKIAFQSFFVIAIGTLACFIGGYLSEYFGTKKMARIFLSLSGLCCLLSPLIFTMPHWLFLVFMLFWGMVVIADSPLFSTLVAQNANPQLKGTALTLVTSIGFGTTVISIQLVSYLTTTIDYRMVFLILIPGPIIGLYFLRDSYSTAASS